MNNYKYSMSFTTGGLFQRESIRLAELYLNLEDWGAVRDKVITSNLLQARMANTSKRISREIISRLAMLSANELNLLVHGYPQEQAHLLWIAVCRRYRFIADFAIEVLRERYISLKNDLTYENFNSFFNRKSEWHLELEKITHATRNKLRQLLFKILHEADLLAPNNMINTTMLSPRLLELILLEGGQEDILYFPIFESDIKDTKR